MCHSPQFQYAGLLSCDWLPTMTVCQATLAQESLKLHLVPQLQPHLDPPEFAGFDGNKCD